VRKILITGATGFIGRQCLIPLLEKGFTVHALAQKPLGGYENDVIWHRQNFLDDEKTKGLIESIKPSHCLHFAWYTEPGKYWSSQ
jgi:nucleoside-diphosphate-sugar epimerase